MGSEMCIRDRSSPALQVDCVASKQSQPIAKLGWQHKTSGFFGDSSNYPSCATKKTYRPVKHYVCITICLYNDLYPQTTITRRAKDSNIDAAFGLLRFPCPRCSEDHSYHPGEMKLLHLSVGKKSDDGPIEISI